MWSLDWFAAEALAKAGQQIRRVGWTDHWLAKIGAIWFIVQASDGSQHVVKATDILTADLMARDWTTEAFNADICTATPIFNTTPVTYRNWTSAPIQLPPPVPGF